MRFIKFLSPLIKYVLVFVIAFFSYSTYKLNSEVQAAPTDIPTFTRYIPTIDVLGGYLTDPNHIAIDSQNNLYVADGLEVQKFNSLGMYALKFDCLGGCSAYGIDVDSSGNIYISDNLAHKIKKFSPTGTLISQFGTLGSGDGQFNTPMGIAIDSSNNLYVADRENYRIQKFNSSGVFVSKFGSQGTGDGQFAGLIDLDIDANGKFYVLDQNRVQVFTSGGVFESKWGATGGGDGEFFINKAIALDKNNGYVYVIEKDGYRIQKFATNGSFLGKWGSYGFTEGLFNEARGIAVSPNGNVYASDKDQSRVQQFSYNNTPPTEASIVPTIGSVITRTNQTISFTTSDFSDCRLSLIDEGYDDMAGDVTCSGSGTKTHTCTCPNLGSSGNKTVYIACMDSSGNKHSSGNNLQLSYVLGESDEDNDNTNLLPSTSFLNNGYVFGVLFAIVLISLGIISYPLIFSKINYNPIIKQATDFQEKTKIKKRITLIEIRYLTSKIIYQIKKRISK